MPLPFPFQWAVAEEAVGDLDKLLLSLFFPPQPSLEGFLFSAFPTLTQLDSGHPLGKAFEVTEVSESVQSSGGAA